jgi:hypothetical protein
MRKNHHLAQETLRERFHQRHGRHHVRKRDALQAVETRRFIRELAGRQVGKLPELGLTAIGSTLLGSIVTVVHLRQMVALTQMLHELRRQVGGHSSFQSRRFFVIGSVNW